MTVNGDAYATKLVEQISQPGGNRITQTFDTLARLLATERRSPGAPGTVLDSATYQYDSRHGRTKQTLADNSYLDCTYDLAGQLDPAFAKNSGGGAVTGEQFDYGYDAGRNMTTRPTGTGMTADDSDDLCGWVERATRPFQSATCRLNWLASCQPEQAGSLFHPSIIQAPRVRAVPAKYRTHFSRPCR